MTLTRHPQSGEIIFKCNNCSDALPTQEDHFPEALQILRKENWLATKDGQDNWVHYCDCCREDYE